MRSRIDNLVGLLDNMVKDFIMRIIIRNRSFNVWSSISFLTLEICDYLD